MSLPEKTFLLPTYLKLCFLPSHLDSPGTIDIQPEVLLGAQTENGIQHNEYNIRGIAHVQYKLDRPPKKRKKKESNTLKNHAHAGITFSACIIPPLQHFFMYELLYNLKILLKLFHNLEMIVFELN